MKNFLTAGFGPELDERKRRGVTTVLWAMRKGQALHLHYRNGRAIWSLSGGIFVAGDVAKAVIARPEIVGQGGALFRNMLGQVWCHVGGNND